jgi:Cu/Zn superoxide dismutase
MRMKRVVSILSVPGVLCGLLATACEDDARDDGGAGASAAGAGGAGAGSGAGAGAGAMMMAAATIAPFGMGNTVTGTVSFMQVGSDVKLTVALANCPDGPHGVHIHQGTSCADAMAQGDHWDMTRGEGIPDVMCTGGTGMSTVTRTPVDPTTAWTIGGAATTNVVGHAFVVHNPGMPAPRIGCGVIAAK